MQSSENPREFFQEMSEELSNEAFEVTEYYGHEFKNLWFDPKSDCFYFYTGVAFRKIYYYERYSELHIQMFDVQHALISISLNNFKKLNNLI